MPVSNMHVQYIDLCFYVMLLTSCMWYDNKWYYNIDTRITNHELQFEFISEENQQLQHKLATMLRMSNAKDWQIAQLEYKLCSQPMMLSSQSYYLKNTNGIYA